MNLSLQGKRKALIAGLFLFVFLTGIVTVRRAVKGSNDFDTFYKAGRAVLAGEGIYYSGEYYETQEGGPFLYPPFAACFFAPFALLPLSAAAFLWNALNIGFFALSIFLSLRILQMRASSLVSLRWKDRLLFTVLSAALLLDNLVMAQVNIFVFTLTLLFLFFLARQKNFLAGLWLAFGVFIKLTPGLFLLALVLKKKWKALGGFLAGTVLFALVLPFIFFGFEKSALFHRQWVGRTLKPELVRWIGSLNKEAAHPLKKKAEILEKDRLTSLLIEKNQSLAAALTRVFLKDRPSYGYEPEPIYAARRYEKMPILIPLSPRALAWVIYSAQALIFLLLIWAAVKSKSIPEITPAFFLAMTLLSPLARSHQYINWIFVYFWILRPPQNWNEGDFPRHSRYVLPAARGAAVLYFLQALPYGKAAGMGTWSNLLLFIACLLRAAGLPCPGKPKARICPENNLKNSGV